MSAQKTGGKQTSCQKSNYMPASVRRRELNTRSEIGRASNATLGVISSSPYRYGGTIHKLNIRIV